MRTFDLLGTRLVATNYEEFTARCQELAKGPGPVAVDLTNTQIVTMRREDPAFREITSSFDYFIPDSTPLTWCLRALGAEMRDRVYGPKFMRDCILASPAPYAHYLLGGSEECVGRLRANLVRWQPGVRIVGARSGYFEEREEPKIVREINDLSPDFIWIGLGTPKQHAWIHRRKASIRRGVILAVGFAFDVNAETKRDAPAWMQAIGLTWFFRMITEPRRLAVRYIRYNSLFLFYLAGDALRRPRP